VGRFTVRLAPGTYTTEWFPIQARQTIPGHAVTVDRSAAIGFRPPSDAAGPTILYLKRDPTT
jgi:hypothetical protein